MNFIDDKINNYAEHHSTGEWPWLQKLNRDTYAKMLQPRMLSGHIQGRLLAMISHMVAPQNILEIGTYTGYSALCLAEGLLHNGMLHTIDVNEEVQFFAQKYFTMSPFASKIICHVGDAKTIIPTLSITFDLIFIDANKEDYSKYYTLSKAVLSKGGFIIADNVLWSGNVLKSPDEYDDETEHIVAFNKMVKNDDDVEVVLLPIRDGITLIRKK